MVRKGIRLGTGIVLVVLGLLGTFLPIIPGFVFLIPGLIILGDFFPPIKKLVEWAKEKFKERFPPRGGDPPPL